MSTYAVVVKAAHVESLRVSFARKLVVSRVGWLIENNGGDQMVKLRESLVAICDKGMCEIGFRLTFR